MSSTRWGRLVTCMALAVASGCASNGASSGLASLRATAPLSPLPARQVEQTLAAEPTLPAATKVAYFVTDPSLARDVESLLESSPRVVATYRIPSVLVTGHPDLDDAAASPRQPLDTELLRRLAASAGADALLVVDYAARERYEPNGLVALGVMLVPLLFVPMRDASSESVLDGLLFDTRTGRELGSVHATRRATEDYVTVYSDAARQLRLRHRRELLDEAATTLGEVLRVAPTPATTTASEEVALPSDTTDPWAEPRQVRVGLIADGTVTLEGQPLDSLAAFVGSLRRHTERGPTVATLFAASSVSYARVREVLELMRRIGIRDVRIEVAPEHEPRDPTTRGAGRRDEPSDDGPDPLGI